MSERRIRLEYDPGVDERSWVLLEPYVRDTSLGTIAVPAGFRTDLASTPWQVWKRYPKLGKWTGAAVIHDWLYRERPHSVSREQADAVFLELLRQDGVPIHRARWMHTQVRLWGSKAWNA